MEINKLISGYPCCSYEVMRIKGDAELWYYCKVYVTTAINHGVSPDLVVSMLVATLMSLPRESGIACPDFNKYGKDAFEICTYIINNPDVPEYKSCATLYKKIDSKLTACRICKESSLYRNSHEEIEYGILKYMLKDESSLSFVLQYIDESFFSSCMEVSMGIPCNKAHVVPIPKVLMKSFLKKNVRILLFTGVSTDFLAQSSEPFDLIWDDAFSTFPRARKIPAVLTSNPMWGNALKQFVKEKIDTAKDYSQEDLRDIFNAYFAGENLDADADVPQYEQGSFSELESLSSTEEQKNDSGKRETSSKEADLYVDDTFPPDPENDVAPVDHVQDALESSVTEQPDQDPMTASIEKPALDPPETEMDPAPISEELVVGNPSENVVHVDNDASAHSMSEDDEETEADELLLSDKEYDLFKSKDIILHVSVSSEFINTHALLLKKEDSLPPAFYHGVLRDKFLSVEVVNVESTGYAILLYSRHTNAFYYTFLNAAPAEVLQLLSRRMVVKVCHTPYLLYGVAKVNQSAVRNVFSLQTAHANIVPGKVALPYADLLRAYPTRKIYGDGLNDECISACPFLAGMPLYRAIYTILAKEIDRMGKPMVYYEDVLLDEAIGSSFLYSLNFKDTGFLAILVGNGKFMFREKYERNNLTLGRFVSYSVKGKESALPMFRYILEKLAERGVFRSYNLQLLGLHKMMMNLYIAYEVEDYLTSLIDLLIFEYGRIYHTDFYVTCLKHRA